MSTFNPTPAEIALISQVFTLSDPQKLGIVTGDAAVKILSRANLSHVVLGEVWAIADKDNNGFLTKKGVAIALRLIGYAQKGEPVTETMLEKPGPLAQIDGLSRPVSTRSPSSPTPQSPSSNPGSTLPPLTSQDKAKFLKLFVGCGPVNGLLSGEKARDVFVKSKLPYEKLSHIWTLADSKARGALDSTDFTIGMYLIQASMSSSSLLLPPILPSWVYDLASQSFDSTTPVVGHATGGSTSTISSPMQNSFQISQQSSGLGAAVSTIKPPYTGQQLPQTPTRSNTSGLTKSSTPSPATAPLGSAQPFGLPWGVSAEAKASSDQFFDGLDSQGRGYIEGDVAVPFMLESKLPESELAHIWDLADLHNDGRLTREGFAVAMHIINSRLAGNDIPSTLPLPLVPLSLRQTQSSTTGHQMDLLLDDTPPSTAVQPQQTGGSGYTHPPAPRPSLSKHNPAQDAFPSPSQSMLPPLFQTRHSPAFTPATNKDLLGDDDDDASKIASLPDDSADIGNLQNQVFSTTRTLDATKSERASAEQTTTQQASQLSQLQNQLSSARASYESESRLLATLRERLVTQRVDIQKTREELINAESELSALKIERAEVEGSILRDKEEVRDLQRRMREVGVHMDTLKAGTEKAKRDVRQQKGLLAIAKKQLATAEAERSKASSELEAVQKEFEVARMEKDDVDAHVAELEDDAALSPALGDSTGFEGIGHVSNSIPSTLAAAVPLPDTPQSTTPQLPASRQSTNPFERLAFASMASDAGSAIRALSPPNGTVPLIKPSDPFSHSSSAANAGLIPVQSSPGAPDGIDTASTSVGATTNPAPGLGSPASVTSPSDNEVLFMTPPSTANPLDVTHDGTEVSSEQQQSFPGAYPSSTHDDGTLSPLRELENDGSETSDSDDEPLGSKLPAAKEDAQVSSEDISPANIASDRLADMGFSPALEPTFGIPGFAVSSSTAAKVSPASGKSSPQRSRSPERALSTRTLGSHPIVGAIDSFGASNFSQTPLEPAAEEVVPPPTIETVLEPSARPPNISTINDFDEALGKVSSSTKDTPLFFKFDSAFDDNFDFSTAVNGAAGEQNSSPEHHGTSESNSGTFTTTFPPVSAPLTPTAVEPVSQATKPTPFLESDAPSFASPFPPQATSPTVARGPSVSFDDAFGLSSSDAPSVGEQHPAVNGAGKIFDVSSGTSQQQHVPTSPLTIAAPALGPILSERSPSPPPARSASPPIRSASPRQPRVSVTSPRTTSPPPRASSPRLRVLSGSKASSSDNKSEMPSKHKLSIRFPFGRKDKSKDKEEKRGQSLTHQQVPEPQQFLSPASDSPLPGTITPAVEDDAEPVKQLAAMGFSRTQSIAALETHGYDMQKALNSLLGAA